MAQDTIKFRPLSFALSALSVLLLSSGGAANAAGPWPGPMPGTSIAANLPAGYEPSGAVWHSRLGKLLTVSDGGIVSMMNDDGTNVVNWIIGGDLEAITVADASTDFVYVGVENPDGVIEFNIATGQIVRTFDLTSVMDLGGAAPPNSGLEALAFVPDASDPEGGLFYAGLQFDGRIYKFRLPIRSSASSTTFTHVGTITPVAGRTDISGLDWDPLGQLLYAVFDSANIMSVMLADGTIVSESDLPGIDQEGIALRPCDLFIAEDSGGLLRYDYSVDTGDADGDGIGNCLDSCIGSCCTPLTLTPTLPDGLAGVVYDELLTATGAVGQAAFAVVSGIVPPGLALASDGRLSGLPTTAGVFTVQIGATDSGGCTGYQGYTLEILPSAGGICLLADDFADGSLDPSWTYRGTSWTESGGYLAASGSGHLTAMADPALATCDICTVSGVVLPGTKGRTMLLGWHQDDANEVELRFIKSKGSILLLQRVHGAIKSKVGTSFALVPDTPYSASISFDGSTFTVSVNGAVILTMPKALLTAPAGTAGFGARKGSGRLDGMSVCQ